MKKRIFCAFLAAMMIFMILPVQALAASNIKGAYVNQNFESVIDTVVGATKFAKGGSIPDGMKVSGTWSYKNTYGDYVFNAMLSGKPTTAGTYSFSIDYLKDDGTLVTRKSYTVTVGEKAPYDYVHSINVDKWPNKTVYYLGDTVDLTGMKVSAWVYIYNEKDEVFEPKEIEVTDLVWVEPAVFTSDEAQDVTVYLKAPADQQGNLGVFESTFRVNFKYANPEDVTRIEIYKKPAKLTYTVGEKLDLSGMTIRAHKGNGTAEDITSGFTADVTKLETVGTKTVTVTYTKNNSSFTATFDVTVTEAVSSEPEVQQPSSSTSTSQPEETSSQPEETSSEPSEETSSQPEETSSQPEETSSEPSEETSSESEPDDIVVMGQDPADKDDDKAGVPFWAWIIIALLVILIGAAVALFLIGRKRLDDDDDDDDDDYDD